MPLKAIIENKEILSFELSSKEWIDLKRQVKKNKIQVILPCCNQPGNLRTSKLGLKHFYHLNKGLDCPSKPETIQHLKAKVEIVKACKENGWEAYPEYIGNGWIADVLATNGKRKIAFEVQWSRQSKEETEFRQERYSKDNIKGCWLMKNIPSGLRSYFGTDNAYPNKDLPIFKLNENEDKSIWINLNKNKFEVYYFIDALFKGHIKLCPKIKTLPTQYFTIYYYPEKCWKCKRDQHLYYVESDYDTQCGVSINPEYNSLWNDQSIEKHPKILTEIKKFIRSDEGRKFKIGKIKERYSKTVGYPYLSFGCYYCDAIFGDYFLQRNRQYIDEIHSHGVLLNLESLIQEKDHWCYSDNNIFCC